MPYLFDAANAVDNLTFFLIFMFWILAPNYLSKYFKVSEKWKEIKSNDSEEEKETDIFNPTHIISLTFLALLIMFVSKWINSNIISLVFSGIPTILIITTLALIFAQFKFVQKLKGAHNLGNLSFYLFFAAVGSMLDIPKAI